jgi:uncharacterized RDD family membrane protein YckC
MSNELTHSSTANNLRYATFQHRLGGIALDGALFFCTCGLGWMIWALVLWGQGQTPGKQILKMRTMNFTNDLPASWGHMAVREFLIPLTVYIASLPLYGLAAVAWIVMEIVFYFTKNQRSFRDYWAKTAVINEA